MKILERFWAPLILISIVLVYFHPVFLNKLVPIPADFIVGGYYPWLDYTKINGLPIPVKNPLLADVPSLIFPLKIITMQILNSGQIPLWNPLSFGGYPLLANFQTSVFNPLNLAYFLFDSKWAWTFQVVLQPLLAALFTYILLRYLKVSKLSSIFGSIVYAFSGFNTIFLEYNTHGHVAAFIPLTLYLVDRFIEERKLIFGLFFSAVLGVQILAGYPQITFYTLVFLGCWVLFKTITKKDKIFTWTKFAFLVGLGIGIAAIQLVPGIELLGLSQRVAEDVNINLKFLPFQQLILLVAPDFYGNPTTYNYWGVGNYTNNTIYSGVVATILAIVALIKYQTNRLIKFFFITAIVCLGVTLPSPISNLIYNYLLPGIGAATATRLFVILNLSITILAAFGLDLISQETKIKNLRRFFYPVLLPLLGFGLGLTLTWVYLKYLLAAYSKYPDIRFLHQSLTNIQVSLKNSLLPFFLIFVTYLLVVLLLRFKNQKYLLIALLIALLSFDLFRFSYKFNPFTKYSYVFPQTPVLNFLQKQPAPFRINGGDVIPLTMWIPYNLESMAGYDAIYPKNVAKLISVLNTGSFEAMPIGRSGGITGYNQRLLDLTNTKYILALKYNKLGLVDEAGSPLYIYDDKKYKNVFQDKSVAVLENQTVLPRTFFVTDWQTLTNDDEIFKNLLDPKFKLDKKIILEEKFNQFSKNQENNAKVSYFSVNFNSKEIKVETEKDGLLFIADTYFPGWEAKVDGVITPILKADYVFQAIPIAAGSHRIKLTYNPQSFEIGKKITFMSIGVLIFGVLFNLYAKKFKKFN